MRRRSTARLLALALGVAGLAVLPPHGPLAQDGEAEGRLVYDVTVTGVSDESLAELLREASALVSLREEAPPNRAGLERRADRDRDRLAAVLRSEGYYDASLDIGVDSAAEPARVEIAVTLGERYRFDGISVVAAGGGALPGAPYRAEDIGIAADAPARGADVVAAEERILGRLRGLGHAFARIADRRVMIERQTRTMTTTWTVDPGPLVRYGPVRISGLDKVSEELVRGRLPWRLGEVYQPDRIDRARTDLSELGVFDLTRVALADAPGANGVTPVEITVTERPRRLVGFGINYSTTDGPGGTAYWGHRNLFGGAETLRLTLEVARIASGSGDGWRQADVSFTATTRKPDLFWPKLDGTATFGASSESPPAYQRDVALIETGIEWHPAERWTATIATRLEWSGIETSVENYKTTDYGLPMTLRHDAADDLFNPRRGWRGGVGLTPWWSRGPGSPSAYAVLAADLAVYLPVSERVVLAGRVAGGGVVGTALRNVPHDKRLYSGGGGSVRGYGFQKIGPRNAAGDPDGGRSRLEASVEARVAVTDTIGVVPFLDAGIVSRGLIPADTPRVAAGLGLRYNTGFGPVRADIAVPVNKARGDDAWQFYLSFGQAF